MAKIKKSIDYIKKMTWEDIQHLTKADLIDIAKFATRSAEKRRTMFIVSRVGDEALPRAYQEWHSKKWRQTTKTGEKATSYLDVDFTMSPDMSYRDLKRRFVLIHNFLKAKTSSATGTQKFFRDFRKAIRTRIAEEKGIDVKKVRLRRLSRYESDILWKAYNRATEINPSIIGRSSTEIQANIYSMITEGNIDLDNLVNNAEKYSDERNIERNKRDEEEYDIRSPLDIGENNPDKKSNKRSTRNKGRGRKK